MRNVEIKARVKDVDKLHLLASQLSASKGKLIEQQDIFFHSTKGRLKLRILQDVPSQLIYYERCDTDGPKMSNYEISDVVDPASMKCVLAQAYGIKGEVKKRRQLYIVGQTRVHVDEVKDLGHFMELEVVLRPDQSLEEGQLIANELMQKLNISADDLITGAYMDLILNKSQT